MTRKRKRDNAARKDEPAGAAPAAGAPALALARAALERGNVRKARQLAAEVVAGGPPAERAEAQALLDRTRPDSRALQTVGAVLLLIILAAWLAIFRAH
jgi:FimV-like protein